jgi:hypothetical protein
LIDSSAAGGNKPIAVFAFVPTVIHQH